MAIFSIRRKHRFVPPLERALYVVLFLSGDAARAEPSVTDTASKLAEVVEAEDWSGLREELASTAWRRKPIELIRELRFTEVLGDVVDIIPLDVGQWEGSFRVIAEQGEWEMRIILAEDGTITGFAASEFRPVERSPALALPVRGEWQVYFGHVGDRAERRAVDFAIVDGEGGLHRDDGLENRDYYSYGEPIHAMAPGRVVMVVDGVPDHVPHNSDSPYRLGNVVVIQHESDLHSVHGHLRPGSARVEAGELVEAGQVLGECGNSGLSRTPHVHVHLQGGPDLDRAWGIEAMFEDVVVERHEFRARADGVVLHVGDRVSAI